jgi:PAS domain S-box-containing protein
MENLMPKKRTASAPEEVRAHPAFEQLQEKYSALFDQASDAIVLWNLDMKITAVNRKAEELSGLKRKHLVGQSVLSVLEEESVKEAVRHFRAMLKSGKPSPQHNLLIKCAEGIKIGEVSSAPIIVEGEVAGFQTVIRDVTERTSREEALRESEEKLRVTFDSLADGVILTDLETRIIDLNDAAVIIFGYKKRNELLGKIALEILLSPASFEQTRAGIRRVLEGQQREHAEYVGCRKDGTEFPIEVGAGLVRDAEGKPAEFITVVKDITERKHAEEALRESEEKLRAMFDSIADGITVTDLDGEILDTNSAALKMYGCSKREEMIGRNGMEFLNKEEQDKARRNMEKVLKEGAIAGIEHTVLRKDGTEYPIETSAAVIRDTNGEPVGLVSIAKDITKRKLAERELKDSEERFRTIFDNATDGIVLADSESRTFYTANRAFCEMLGYSIEEIREIGVNDIHPKKDLPAVLKQFERQLKKEITLAEDIPVLTKDGRIIHADVNSTPVTVDGREHLMGVFRDVTIRKEMEKRLLQSQKLESLGMFAAGLVHDFKEYLSKVFGLASYLRNSLDSKSANYSRVVELAGAAQGVSELVDRLNMFSGQTVVNPALMSIDAPINETIRVLRRYVRPNVKIDLRLDARPGTLKADYWQIEKVILNVLTNACDAMPSGGTVKVATSEKEVSDKLLKANAWMKPGRHVVISISDTGTGISRDVLDRIFDPFFTTKGPGKGAGLGLSIAYGIVKDHKGTIEVRSTVGKGSRFDIYLPAAKS